MTLRDNPAWNYFKFMSQFAQPVRSPRALRAEFRRQLRERRRALTTPATADLDAAGARKIRKGKS